MPRILSSTRCNVGAAGRIPYGYALKLSDIKLRNDLDLHKFYVVNASVKLFSKFWIEGFDSDVYFFLIKTAHEPIYYWIIKCVASVPFPKLKYEIGSGIRGSRRCGLNCCCEGVVWLRSRE